MTRADEFVWIVRSIIIKAGPGEFTPDKVKIVRFILDQSSSKSAHSSFIIQFANQSLDFGEAESTDCTQSVDIAITRDATEYALR